MLLFSVTGGYHSRGPGFSQTSEERQAAIRAALTLPMGLRCGGAPLPWVLHAGGRFSAEAPRPQASRACGHNRPRSPAHLRVRASRDQRASLLSGHLAGDAVRHVRGCEAWEDAEEPAELHSG